MKNNECTQEIPMMSFREFCNLTNNIKQSTCFFVLSKHMFYRDRAPGFSWDDCFCTCNTLHFQKRSPIIMSYRDFSYYQNLNFINSLNEVLMEEESLESLLKDPSCFYKVCTKALIQHAPRKKSIFLEVVNNSWTIFYLIL